MKKIIIFFVICCTIIVVALTNYNKILKMIYKTDYKEYVEKYAKQYDIDPLLVYSIIKAESNFKEGALSKKGACGLMQLMDETAKEVAENTVMEYESGTTLYNPEKNIYLGIAYYADLKAMYKNDELALTAYNAGIGNVNKWIAEGTLRQDGSDIENIPFKETNTYVRKILNNYKVYKRIYGNDLY